MRAKLFAILEVLLVYALIQAVGVLRRATGIVQWELEHLGWTYTGMLCFVGIPALVIWLTRRSWAEYGVSLTDWPTNLDLGLKAYLVRLFTFVFGLGGARLLKLDAYRLGGGAYVALVDVVGIALMVWLMNRQEPIRSGRRNIITTLVLLLFPIVLALALGRLSLVVVSTVVWQFIFSGFGEEFVCRGFVQSRLNQAFGRPLRLCGVQFGAGLVIASLLFGLMHAFNTYQPAIGFRSLSWGWALWTFTGGLFFGAIREKTGTLVAPGIAHGLPDAAGEALMKIFGWRF